MRMVNEIFQDLMCLQTFWAKPVSALKKQHGNVWERCRIPQGLWYSLFIDFPLEEQINWNIFFPTWILSHRACRGLFPAARRHWSPLLHKLGPLRSLAALRMRLVKWQDEWVENANELLILCLLWRKWLNYSVLKIWFTSGYLYLYYYYIISHFYFK